MVTIKKFLKAFMLFYTAFSLLLVSVNAQSGNTKKNKAIIVVPGILTSGLFYTGEPNLKYSKNESIWMGVNGSKTQALKAVSKFFLYYKDLFYDENGVPLNKDVGLSKSMRYISESDSKMVDFGVLNTCEKLIGELNKNFGIKSGGDYRVILHNYDWRKDCAENSKLLAKKIMSFDEVIIVAHSMGGLVSCGAAGNLLSNSVDGDTDKLQEKIKAFISLGVPYNGASDAVYLLEKGMFTDNAMIDKFFEKMGIPEIIRELSYNCVSTYELIPTREFFKNSEDGFICSEKDKSLSYDESMKLLKTRAWAKKSDGTVKDFFDKAEKFHKSLYVNGTHIANLMNSYFIVGCGMRTKDKLIIDKNSENSAETINYVEGDGTVALKESAVPPGKTLDDVIKVYCQHNNMFNDELVIKHVINIISKNISSEVK